MAIIFVSYLLQFSQNPSLSLARDALHRVGEHMAAGLILSGGGGCVCLVPQKIWQKGLALFIKSVAPKF
eukprot:scaffold53457_cov76-Cyclotella_meneghiniana.AAC.5